MSARRLLVALCAAVVAAAAGCGGGGGGGGPSASPYHLNLAYDVGQSWTYTGTYKGTESYGGHTESTQGSVAEVLEVVGQDIIGGQATWQVRDSRSYSSGELDGLSAEANVWFAPKDDGLWACAMEVDYTRQDFDPPRLRLPNPLVAGATFHPDGFIYVDPAFSEYLTVTQLAGRVGSMERVSVPSGAYDGMRVVITLGAQVTSDAGDAATIQETRNEWLNADHGLLKLSDTAVLKITAGDLKGASAKLITDMGLSQRVGAARQAPLAAAMPPWLDARLTQQALERMIRGK